MLQLRTISASFLIFGLSFLLSGCWTPNSEPEPQLGLPEQSQRGANHAGCRLDGDLWISHGKPMLIRTTGQLTIEMSGLIKSIQNKTRGDATITFIIKESNVLTIDSLPRLHGKTYRLEGVYGFANVRKKIGSKATTCSTITGTLKFDNVQKQRSTSLMDWNEEIEWYLLAGTFELDKKQDCAEFEIKEGRFDFAIDQNNFRKQ